MTIFSELLQAERSNSMINILMEFMEFQFIHAISIKHK